MLPYLASQQALIPELLFDLTHSRWRMVAGRFDASGERPTDLCRTADEAAAMASIPALRANTAARQHRSWASQRPPKSLLRGEYDVARYRRRRLATLESITSDNAEFTHLSRGQHWPGPVPALGIRLAFNSKSGPSLHIGLNRPTPKEVRAVRHGRIQFGLVPAGRHTQFVLVHQPDLFAGEWGDAPFAFMLSAPEDRVLPEPRAAGESQRGYIVMVYLTDEAGLIHAMRGITVSPAFTDELHRLCREQIANTDGFTVAAHQAEVVAAYRRWPSSNEIATAATVIETAGRPFDSR